MTRFERLVLLVLMYLLRDSIILRRTNANDVFRQSTVDEIEQAINE